MAEESGKKEFDLEGFIERLGEKGFNPGHQAGLQKGEDPDYLLQQEVSTRVSRLATRVELMEMKKEDSEIINSLKKRGIEKILSRFPDRKEEILDKLGEHGSFAEDLNRIREEDKKA